MNQNAIKTEATVKSFPVSYPPKPDPMRGEAIAARLSSMQAAGVKSSRIAVEAGISRDALEIWIKGERNKETTEALSAWIEGIDKDVAEKDAGFVMTPSAGRFLHALEQARVAKDNAGRRGIALIFGASGAGKTETASWVCRMDKNVAYVLVDGEFRTWTKLLGAVAQATDPEFRSGYPAQGESLRDLILRRIPVGGLLIFDHAHLLRLSIMEQLITFPDTYGIGIAFIGNTKGYKTIIDAKVAQIMSRVAGANVFVNLPGEGDVDALMESNGIGGRKEREFCHLIAIQDGGLHYYSSMVREARKLAAASGATRLDLALLKLGAVNAGCWGAQE